MQKTRFNLFEKCLISAHTPEKASLGLKLRTFFRIKVWTFSWWKKLKPFFQNKPVSMALLIAPCLSCASNPNLMLVIALLAAFGLYILAGRPS